MKNSRMVAACVSKMDSITNFSLGSITATEDRYLMNVEPDGLSLFTRVLRS